MERLWIKQSSGESVPNVKGDRCGWDPAASKELIGLDEGGDHSFRLSCSSRLQSKTDCALEIGVRDTRRDEKVPLINTEERHETMKNDGA